ncbi:MAG: acyl-CoA synthetase [Acidobacteriota bacterium]
MPRRATVAIIGDGGAAEGTPVYEAARAAGRLAVDRGYRVVSGGLGGVMEAAFRGARDGARYQDGDTIAILPKLDPGRANDWADIAIPTGLGHQRNALVAASDAVIAIGGGAGTLCEIAFAWMFGRLVIAIPLSGWARELADRRLDDKVRFATIPEDRIFSAATPEGALEICALWIERYRGERQE